MGSKRKTSAKKKEEVPVAAEVLKPQVLSGKASNEDEIEEIFAKKRKAAPENQSTLAEDVGIESQSSPQKKKKTGKKTTSPVVEQDGRRKAGLKESSGGKAGKSSSAGVSHKRPRKKTADGLTIYGEDELKWNSKDAGGTSLCPFDCECCF